MVSRRHVLIPGKFQTFPTNTNSYSHHRDSMARIIPARSLNSLSINNNTQSYSAQLTGSNQIIYIHYGFFSIFLLSLGWLIWSAKVSNAYFSVAILNNATLTLVLHMLTLVC